METIAERVAPFRLLRYAGALVLTLISAACLTLSYIHEGWFSGVVRVALGLGLPWVVARLCRRRTYWVRLGFFYLGVVVIGGFLILMLPIVLVLLCDYCVLRRHSTR